MTNPYSDVANGKLGLFCQKVFDLLEANKVPLGLADVFYGDQQQIPRTPAACVEPDGKRRILQGVPRRTENTFGLYVLLYISEISQSVQDNARESIEFAERVEDLLHADPTLDGLLIHSFCVEVEPGYRMRKDTRFRACRIKFEGINKTVLGM